MNHCHHLMAKLELVVEIMREPDLTLNLKSGTSKGRWRKWRTLQNHAGGVTDLVIYLTNAKHLLFNILHAVIPPLDGQTLPESQQEIEIFA